MENYVLVKITSDPMAYWVVVEGVVVGNVAQIGRFGDWTWSSNCQRVDTTETFGLFKSKEDAAVKVVTAANRKH